MSNSSPHRSGKPIIAAIFKNSDDLNSEPSNDLHPFSPEVENNSKGTRRSLKKLELRRAVSKNAYTVDKANALNKTNGSTAESESGQRVRRPSLWKNLNSQTLAAGVSLAQHTPRKQATGSVHHSDVSEASRSDREEDESDSQMIGLTDDEGSETKFYGLSQLGFITKPKSSILTTTINLDSQGLRIWMLLVLSCLIYVCFMAPIQAAFLFDSMALFVINVLVEVVFFLDIFRCFLTSYIDSGELIRDRAKIARRYIKHDFLLDVLAIIPLYFAFLAGSNASGLFGINRLLRLFHIHRGINNACAKNSVKKFSQLFKLILDTFFLIHIIACAWFALGRLSGFGKDQWLPRLQLADADIITQYLTSLFWAVGIMLSQSDSELPNGALEVVFTLFVHSASVLLFAYVVGMVANIAGMSKQAKAQFDEKLNYVKHFMRHYSVPKPLQEQVMKYFDYTRSTSNALDSLSLVGLPLDLDSTIKYHLAGPTVRNIDFIRAISRAGRRSLLNELELRVYTPSEVIIRERQAGLKMFIVLSGRVYLKANFKGVSRNLSTLGTGLYFGDENLVGLRSLSTATCTSFCEVFTLSTESWKKLSNNYKEDCATIRHYWRLQRTRFGELIAKARSKRESAPDLISAQEKWSVVRETMLQRRKSSVIRARSFLEQFYIDPSRMDWRLFNMISKICVLYYMVALPFKLSYEFDIPSSKGRQIFDCMIDTIVLFKVLIHTRVAFVEKGILQRDPVIIQRRYWTLPETWVQVIACFPLNLFSQAHIWKLNRLLHTFYFIKRFNQILDDHLPARLIKLINLLLGFVLLTHWTGCIYFSFAFFEGFGTNTWLPSRDFEMASSWKRFSRSLFFSFKVLTRVGPMTKPATNAERIFTICMAMFGLFVIADLISNVGALIVNLDLYKSQFQQNFNNMNQYMSYHKVPIVAQKEIQRYLAYKWQANRGAEPQRALALLPFGLRKTIMMHFCQDMMRNVTFMKAWGDEVISELVVNMSLETLPKGQFVFRKNDIGSTMYFILKGSVQLILDEMKSMRTLKSLQKGDFFGEQSLISGDLRTVSIRTTSPTQFMVLTRQGLLDVLESHPIFKKSMKIIAAKRNRELSELSELSTSMNKPSRHQ